jgi:hypothetical protein
MIKNLFLCFLAATTLSANAQQKIKDGTGTPVTSLPAAGSLLELQSTQKGLRFPQVSLTDTKIWAPMLGSGVATTSPGMTVYNTNAGITNFTGSIKYLASGIGEYYWDGGGWVSKNATTAQNTDVVLRAEFSGTQSVFGGETLDFTSVKFDKGSNFNLATDKFTAPSTGYYLVNLNVNCTTGVSYTTGRSAFLVVNGVTDRTLFNEEVATNNGLARTAPALLRLAAGNTVWISIGSAFAQQWDFTSAILEITKLSN